MIYHTVTDPEDDYMDINNDNLDAFRGDFEKAMLDKANLKGAILKDTVWGTAFKEKAVF